MAQISYKSVLVAGGVAGVVMNVLDVVANYFTGALLRRDLDAINPVLWQTMSAPGRQFAYLGVDFVLALLIVWLYAAIRSRFGGGPRTALYAAACFWMFSTALWYLFVLMGLLSSGSFVASGIASAVNFAATALVGGKLYRERDQVSPAPAPPPTP